MCDESTANSLSNNCTKCFKAFLSRSHSPNLESLRDSKALGIGPGLLEQALLWLKCSNLQIGCASESGERSFRPLGYAEARDAQRIASRLELPWHMPQLYEALCQALAAMPAGLLPQLLLSLFFRSLLLPLAKPRGRSDIAFVQTSVNTDVLTATRVTS